MKASQKIIGNTLTKKRVDGWNVYDGKNHVRADQRRMAKREIG
jgi:hypothetical protein